MKRFLIFSFISITIMGSEQGNDNYAKNYNETDFEKGFFGSANLIVVKKFDSKTVGLESPVIPIECISPINPDDSIKVNIVHGFSHQYYNCSRKETLLKLLEKYSPESAEKVQKNEKQLYDFFTYTTDTFINSWSRRDQSIVNRINWKIKNIKTQACIIECSC